MGLFKRLITIIVVCSLIFANIGGIGMAQDIDPKPLRKGTTVPTDGYFFTEEGFVEILKLKHNYKIEKDEWQKKEEIYKKSLKKLGKVPFFQSFKCGFVVGIGLIILSAYVVGQIK